MHEIQGNDMTALGVSLYGKFTSGPASYTAQVEYHNSGEWGSDAIGVSSIATLDATYTKAPILELTPRADAGARCVPQVRFTMDVRIHSEDGLLDGQITAHGYLSLQLYAPIVMLEYEGPLASLGGSIGASVARTGTPPHLDRFHWDFYPGSAVGEAILFAAHPDARNPLLFEWLPLCGATPSSTEPSLVNTSAVNCGTAYVAGTASPFNDAILNCTKNALASSTPVTMSWATTGGDSVGGSVAPLSAVLASGRAPYVETSSVTSTVVGGKTIQKTEIRRCQAISVKPSCDINNISFGQNGPCASCVSPGPWIPMCFAPP